MAIRWLHLVVGVVVFFVFTTTGSYMRADFPNKDAIPPEFRMLMRSRHIYILFSALIHLAIAAYFRLARAPLVRTVQVIGSVLLLCSSGLLIWAFAAETYSFRHASNISSFGIFTSLAAVIIQVIGGFAQQREP
jgi:uncharacterized membrane protein